MITTILTAAVTVVWCAGAIAAASRSLAREEHTAESKELWRLHRLRNGVTAEIPFADPQAAINTPGLVQVFPDSHTAAPNAPAEPAPTLKAAPQQAESQKRKLKESQKVSIKKTTKKKWGYPQGCYQLDSQREEATQTLKRLVADGETRKTVLSWAVFGSSGGKIYTNARPLIEEILNAG